MAKKEEDYTVDDLINYSVMSYFLTGRTDNLRENRISKKYRKQVDELKSHLEFWLSKNRKV